VKRLRALNQSQAELIQTLELAVSSRDEVIADQAAALDGRDQLVAALIEDRDHWKASAEAREQQAVAERIAKDAQESASKANLWIGRAEGGGAVAATAYALHLLGVL
jgi:peptidoglycan hydrolase CwlO-like protein